jgi:uncharacterized protein YqgV (UPF0045/DUF77 family)
MGTIFEPNEKLEQIMYLIKEVNELRHDCDSEMNSFFENRMGELFKVLHETLSSMKASNDPT